MNMVSNPRRFLSLFATVCFAAVSWITPGVSVAADGARALSVVFIGNSITRHGPSPAVNWKGDWGMAASKAETDYASQVVRRLKEGGLAVKSTQAFNIAAFELNPKEVQPGGEPTAAGRAADLLVVELGDNVKSPADFAPAYARLLAQAKPAKGRLMCLSTWWQSAAVDAVIQPACARAGGVFVDIGDIHAKPGTNASTTQGLSDPGVLRHPGDAGMAEIATRIVAAWRAAAQGRH